MEIMIQSEIQCPHCGEIYQTVIDSSQGGHITTEDCPVCCRPIQLNVSCEPGELFSVDASAE
jgi:hypothetical protein